MKKFILFSILSIITLGNNLFAQCAMCRASLENNLSNGDLEIGSTLNFGILYLFFTPYLALAVIGFFWYRNSKRIANV